jgi:dihydrofolate synthase / folylpolyglutamate synthase
MNVHAIKTRKLIPPRDDLWEVLDASLPQLEEDTVVAISSKIVSIGEGRCVPAAQVTDKDALITREADLYVERDHMPGNFMHTIARGVLTPASGIDLSNGAGHYVLWPEDPYASARELWSRLRRRHGVRRLGVIVTDSRSTPLRRGVTGYALAHHGFRPLLDYRGTRDIFGRKLRLSQSNHADAIATAAVLVMGEGNEQTPLAVVTGVPGIRFLQRAVAPSEREFTSLEVPMEEDLYWPLMKRAPWKKPRRSRRPTTR